MSKTPTEQQRWNNAYTRGTLRPTNLDNLYPDTFGHFDRIANDRLEQRIKWVARTITAMAAMFGLYVALPYIVAVVGWLK